MARKEMRSSGKLPAGFLLLPLFSLLAVLIAPWGTAWATDDFEDDQVVVGLLPGASMEAVNARYGTRTLDWIPGTRDYLLGTLPGVNLDLLAEQMSADPEIEYAEKNHTTETAEGIQKTTASFDRTATSAEFRSQPAVQVVSGGPAHTIATGSSVLVAVLDTGVGVGHPELAERLSPAGFDFIDGDAVPAETANGLDEDGDGTADEGFGHGTHVGGLVLLAAPGATILPVRVLDDEGRAPAYRVARGIRYAVSQGARVINLSLSVRRHSSLIGKAIREALDRGVTVVAAVGNAGANGVDYPASESDVVATAATDDAGVKTPFSNYGSAVRICAPGQGLLSPFGGEGYARWSGTSMAAPIVAGGAALLMERYFALPPREVLRKIQETATSIAAQNPGLGGKLGAGLVNLEGLSTVAARSADSLRVRFGAATVASWQPVEAAISYDLVRGDLASLHVSGGTVSLGSVACLLDHSSARSNSAQPDAALPVPGRGFFYLMRYRDDDERSEYGRSSAGRPRVPASGDCPL